MIVHGGEVKPGQRFRFKESRGLGTFTVEKIDGERVTLRERLHNQRQKTIGVKTLRGDYERMD